MTRFNFREACLLDASGELGPAARRQFLDYLRENPDASLEYEEIRRQFDALDALCLTETSAAQRRAIPAEIKLAIAQLLRRRQHEKRATTRRQLIRYALAGVASTAAAMLLVASLSLPGRSGRGRPEREQVARLNATIDHLAGLGGGDQPVTPYEQAVTDVEASIRQLQAESPTLAELHDKNMDELLDALATVPSDTDDFAVTDTPGSPGSM